MFQSINFRSNHLFAANPDTRETASIRAWDAFNATKVQVLSPTWEDRVVKSDRFGQDARVFWNEKIGEGILRVPGREEPVRFTRESPFLQQLCAHYQIDKRLVDRLLDTRKEQHREVMEFLIASLMMTPFKEIKSEFAGRMVRVLKEEGATDEAMAFLSNNFLRLDHGPYFESAERWARAHGLVPIRTWANGGDAGINFVQPRDIHPNGIKKGEMAAFGIATKNSMTGGASFEVNSYAQILICTNGMMGTEFLGRFTRRHIGRRIGASDQALELTTREEADVTAILGRAHDIVEEAMNPEHHAQLQDAIRVTAEMTLEHRLQGFRDARAAFMDNQKVQTRAAQELTEHLGLSQGEAIGVLNRWFEEPAGEPIVTAEDPQAARIPTAWGLIQATTRLGRDVSDEKPQKSDSLESIGGSMLKRFRDSRKEFDKLAADLIGAATK